VRGAEAVIRKMSDKSPPLSTRFVGVFGSRTRPELCRTEKEPLYTMRMQILTSLPDFVL
jgi:hypothetical protein